MRLLQAFALLLAGALIGCMASGPPLTAQAPAREIVPRDGEVAALAGVGRPLIIDRTDTRLGTTAQFDRVPTTTELHDLTLLPGLAHIVVALPAWPDGYEAIQNLDRTPPETDLIVVLPGYPPTREASQAWNLVNAPLRLVLVVPGPPASVGVIDDLNRLRGLERVIAQMDEPSRSGFERLQRPLSFRKIVP